MKSICSRTAGIVATSIAQVLLNGCGRMVDYECVLVFGSDL